MIVRGILFDLLPLHWQQLALTPEFDYPRTSLVTDARIVQHRTKEALA